MEPIPFPRGQASLDLSGLALLDDLAVALSWFETSCTIEVAGHAWGEGSDEEQRALALQRAELVRDELLQRGLRPRVLRVRSYGPERPVSTDSRSEREAVLASRRVELWLHQRTVDNPLPCSDPGTSDCCRAC